MMNQSNMLIWCSRNIFFQDFLINRKNLFEKDIFYNIVNVFTVTFDQVNVFLLN